MKRISAYDRGMEACRKIVAESATLRGIDAQHCNGELRHYLYAAWMKGYETGFRKGRKPRSAPEGKQ